jgi:hypothetical protein
MVPDEPRRTARAASSGLDIEVAEAIPAKRARTV